MDQSEDPDIFPGARVNRDLRGDTKLHKFATPDDPRVDRSCNLSLAVCVHTGLHRELGNEYHAVKGNSQTYILHKGLKVDETVL